MRPRTKHRVKRWHPERWMDDEIRRRYRFQTLREIAAIIGVSKTYVHRRLKAMSVARRPQGRMVTGKCKDCGKDCGKNQRCEVHRKEATARVQRMSWRKRHHVPPERWWVQDEQ